MATRKQTGKIQWFYYCNETYFAVLSHIMEMAVFSLKFCRLCGQMQTLEWLKNDFHFAEICDEVINHVAFVLTAEQYKIQWKLS